MKILHIIPDDKFWLSPIQVFSPLPFENEYICVVGENFNHYEYIKFDITPCSIDACKQQCDRKDIDVFMFHSLQPSFYDMILEIPQNKKVIVSTWGYDIYYSQYGLPPICPVNLYKRRTSAYINRIDALTPVRNLYHIGKAILRPQARRREAKRLHWERVRQSAVIERADYWATVLPTEFERLSKIHGFKAQYFPFQYVTKGSSYSLDLMAPADADRILVGNSADPSNNYLDLLALIRKRRITNQIYLPLAYGNQEYANKVETYVHKKDFNVLVQRTFIPYSEYVSTVRSCRVGIFGHLRQQAIGNIYACFAQGSKVFLYKDSMAYKYFKSNGYFVFSIEDDLTQQSIDELLTEEQVQVNINKLKFLDFDIVQKKVEASLMDIQKHLT